MIRSGVWSAVSIWGLVFGASAARAADEPNDGEILAAAKDAASFDAQLAVIDRVPRERLTDRRLESLLSMVDDRSTKLVALALTVRSTVASPGIVRELRKLRSDPDPEIRAFASLVALSERSRADPDDRSMLERDAAAGDDAVMRVAAAMFTTDADLLTVMVNDSAPLVRAAAVGRLARIVDEPNLFPEPTAIRAAVVAAAADDDPLVRCAALFAVAGANGVFAGGPPLPRIVYDPRPISLLEEMFSNTKDGKTLRGKYLPDSSYTWSIFALQQKMFSKVHPTGRLRGDRGPLILGGPEDLPRIGAIAAVAALDMRGPAAMDELEHVRGARIDPALRKQLNQIAKVYSAAPEKPR